MDVTKDRLLFAWVGGTPLPEDGLAHIFDYLFASHTAAATRPMVQLAIALNAILQRKPRLLRIESGDGSEGGTIRLDLDRKGNAVLGTPEEYLAGTYLLAEFGRDWLPRFAGAEQTRESDLIEEACRYTPVPILLNGAAPFGYRASRDLVMPGVSEQVAFDDGQRRGVLGVPGQHIRDFQVEIVVGGVRVTSVPADELTGGPPLVGIICDDTLRKTADQSDIVRDAAWLRMRHALKTTLTRTMRRRYPRFEHPSLPNVPKDEPTSPARDEPAPAAVSPKPLPKVLDCVGPGDGGDLHTLQGLADDEPLFYVHPSAGDALRQALDPARFPHRVLVLDEGQVVTLRKRLKGRSISRLVAPSDADFVRTALAQGGDPVDVVMHTSLETEDGTIAGALRLRHHGAGPLPGWGDPGDGPVPLLVSHEARAALQRRLPLALRGVSVHFTCDEPPPKDLRPLAEALSTAVLEQGWRLAEALKGAGRPGDHRDFLARLLGVVVWPQLVETGQNAGVEPGLPASWPAAARPLLDTPLTTTSLTVRKLASLQGTASVHRLDSDAELDALEGLEQTLGMGHITSPALEGSSVLAVGWTRSRWRLISGWFPEADQRENLDVVAALLVLPTVTREPELPAGWRRAHSPGPGLLQIERVDVSNGRWRWSNAKSRLLRALEKTVPAKSARGPVSLRRAVERLRLARVQLSDDLEHVAAALGTKVARRGGLSHPDVRVLARHGMPLLEGTTVAMTCDELASVEERLGSRLALRFDDAPVLWADLLLDESDGWLLKERAHAPGLRATLGLRVPFDATTGVLVSSLDGFAAVPAVDVRQPCHGIAQLSGGGVQVTPEQLLSLLVARDRMYRRLRRGVEEHRWSGTEERAATQYLEAADVRTEQRAWKPAMGFFADHLEQVLGEGKRRLRRVHEEEHGPPVTDVKWKNVVALAANHPLVRRALGGERDARDLLMVEIFRVVAESEERPSILREGLVRLAAAH
ncbi:MAG: hypothetical protein KDA24_17630 [Deltaproteobacteria bacterium]|nr:hypothetical protein [Deltaproteobacteria bacterium]